MVLFILTVVISILPVLTLLSASLRRNSDLFRLTVPPDRLTLANYRGVMDFMDFPVYFRNTLVIAAGCTALDVLCSCLCAWPLSELDFPGKKLILSLLTGTVIVPAASGMIINYLTISRMHLADSMLGVILPEAVHPLSILLVRRGYMSVPREVKEAARIDGAGGLTAWRNVFLPAAQPYISTVMLFDFISSWNSFLWPVIVLQDTEKFPIATALQYLNGSMGYRFGYVAAGTILSIIPVVVLFILLQRSYRSTVTGALLD